MLSLAEYRHGAHRFADHLPWAALVAEGIVLNKDGSFLRVLAFRGPDLESATEAELVSACARANNVLKRFGTGWALHFEAERREALGYPDSRFPDPASWLVDQERRARFEAEGAHFESRYHLTLTWLPAADGADAAGRSLVDRPDASQGRDWRGALANFVAETTRAADLFAAFMPEVHALNSAETLTYLHGVISTRRHPVAVPETPMYLDSLLADTAQAAEQERALAELKAARESGVLVQGRQEGTSVASTQAATAEPGTAAPASTASPEPPKLGLDPANDPNAQGRKTQFIGALDPRGDVNPHALTLLPSPYTLSAGSVISASLITGLRSDLPGLVTAQVTENTYDSATGRILLIPQGSRLIGSYDSVVAFGQSRALVVWQRIILPNGSSLRIDNLPATDPSGFAGLQDKVDFHTWQLLKGIALSTLLGVSSELALSGQGDLIQAIRQSTQDNVSRAGGQITQHNLGIQPTITIRQGAPVRLVVHKDLVLAPWNGKER